MKFLRRPKRSLATKRKRGLINPKVLPFSSRVDPEYHKYRSLKDMHNRKQLSTYGENEYRRLALKFGRRRGLVKNRCNPKKRIRYKMADYGYEKPIMAAEKHQAKKSTIIYDKLLGIEARKSHGKFKGQNFFHDFKKNTDAMVVGNPDGSLTIKSSKGKRLWKKFKY